jgi:hypothetical protein
MQTFAQENPVFEPSMKVILDITNSFPALVTTSVDGIAPAPHKYQNGLIVRLLIPPGYGMTEANQLTGTVRVVSADQFNIDIDTTYFSEFDPPTRWPLTEQQAQVVPVGEVNSILTQATQNVLR